MRLFVAIELPTTIKHELQSICSGLPGARWVPPEQMHLTLRFIGEADEDLFQDICAGLARVEAEEFTLALQGLGCFPPRKNHRVLWLGTERNDSLLLLHSKVESALAGCHLIPEKKEFSPHVTLARLKKTPLHHVTRFLAANELFSVPAFTVTTFQLFSSELTPRGAVHRVEAAYRLAAREGK